MSRAEEIRKALAKSFVIGAVDEETLVKNASITFFDGKKPRWLRPLARHVAEDFASISSRPLWSEVAESTDSCPSFISALEKGKVSFGPNRTHIPPEMSPARGGPENWQIPPATNLAELAELLEIHIDDLGWLIAQRGTAEHYHLRWHQKRGTAKSRLIEIPKPLLKQTQRVILDKILRNIPAHEKACGFQAGRSILDFVVPHTGQAMVLKMDFRDFFPSISSGRIMRFFMAAGYPETVSGALTDLCTNAVDPEILETSNLDLNSRVNLMKKHLPQGAPTSPGLANLCTFRLDCRLTGLAKTVDADYTRYADDLLFSGDDNFRRQSQAFHIKALTIAIEEGFRINTRKTRFMGKSQRQIAAGLVMNQRPNLSRRDFDRLKAILTNCVRHGWQSQNRDNHPDFRAYLEGRVGWAVQANPVKAEKLHRLLKEIEWNK